MSADIQPKIESRIPGKFLILFAVIAAGIVSAGYFYYHGYEKFYRDKNEQELSAIAELKVDELKVWREERLADAALIFENAPLADLVRRYFQDPLDKDVKRQIGDFLDTYTHHPGYDQVRLIDPQGVTRLSFPADRAQASAAVVTRIPEVMASRKITIVDLYRHDHDKQIYLSMLIPVLDKAAGNQAIGVVALRTDPKHYLYPFILSWPTLSKTAETLLVRREGNDVLYLNELKFQKNSALTLRYPLTETERPAVQAVLGRTGIMQGIDYQGKQVIADMRPVPDSPWFLTTRINLSEVLAPAQEKLWMIIALAASLIIGMGAGFTFIWRQKNLDFYRERYQAAEALRESEESLSITLHSIGDGVIATDNEGRITRMNAVAERLTGWPLSDARDKLLSEVFQIVNAKTRKPVDNPIQHVLESGTIVGLANHTVLISQKGTEYQIADSAAPIRTADGKTRGVILVFSDVTERYRADEALRRSEEKFRVLFESANDGIFLLSSTGAIVTLNTAFARMHGYMIEEMLTLNLSDLDAPETAQMAPARLQRLFAGEPISFEAEHYCKNGQTIPIEVSANLVVIDNDKYILGFHHDISERKKAEETIQKNEAKYRNLFDSSTDGIFIIDLDGNFVDVNSTAYTRLGYTKEEMLSLHISKLDHPQFAPQAPERMQQVQKNGYTMFESAHLRKDGTAMPVEVNSRLIEYEGRSVYFSMIRDITERKKMEQTLLKIKKLEATASLAGGIAHDYNNLLTVIQGNIELAEAEAAAIGSPQAKALSEAMKATRRAAALTRKFITFSSGGAPVKKAISPHEFIRDTTSIALSGSNIQCDFSIVQDLAMVEIDPGQMSQALGNIITNAKEAMPQGGTIRLTAHNLSAEQMIQETGLKLQSDLFIKISVTDHGKGIPQKDLANIFDPYFSSKERGVQKGMGLGLSITHSIIEKHGGCIQVESEEGRGTTVSIYLPALEQKEAEVSPSVSPADATPTQALDKKTTRILVMDDEEMIRDMSQKLLGALGYEQVEVAPHGEEVLKIYTQALEQGKMIELLLLDLTIKGGMGGEETMRRLLAINPKVRALVCSGYANDPIIANFADYGFCGVLRKPFSINELNASVSKALDAKI